MKIGLILECQFGGPDEQVLRSLFSKFAPQHEVDVAPQGNKALLLQWCGVAARQLLAGGCDRVVIVWDLHPADWGSALQQRNRTPCRREDRQRILGALEAAGVNTSQVALVAIEYMLESWLLADSSAIKRFLERRLRRRMTAQQCNADPATEDRPKDALSKIFERHGHEAYRDHAHAVLIARQIVDLTEVQRRCPTFQRFWEKATAGG
jgi:hypothetical protein